jgi:hypothetical protein
MHAIHEIIRYAFAPTFAGDQECVFPGRLVVLRNTNLGLARKALVAAAYGLL